MSRGGDILVENDPLIPNGLYDQDINIDEAITQGVEISTGYQFSPDWRLNANYTYTDSEQKSGGNKGEPLTDTPEHAVNATLRWQATAKLDAWFSAEYRSERYRNRERVRGAPSFDDLGDFNAYSLFNLGGNYAFTEQFMVSATIYNLFDKDFVDYQSYASTNRSGKPQTSYGNRYANSEEGRRLWLSARYAF
ncbi:TonB-dependent receptor [Halomonas sp. ATCHA]|uniref:TonB-dependent receptor n=1 Tax=Halomonas llamarensis TaxID=2945104 RepID=A0ABT0SNY9_9GAMM|nr:TonB-dependent receptor [Halomonas llamarensis]